MEFLRHLLRPRRHRSGRDLRNAGVTANQVRSHLRSIFVGIAAALLGFHTVLSNIAPGVIVMPFVVAFAVSLALSFALRTLAR